MSRRPKGIGSYVSFGDGDGTSIIIPGLTTTGVGDGDAVYISGINTVTKTDAASLSTAKFFGFGTASVGSVQISGVIDAAKFTTFGGKPANGEDVYLALASVDSGTGVGKLIAIPPLGPAILSPMGICLDNSNYALLKTCKIGIQAKTRLALGPPIPTELIKITASNAFAGDRFGNAVSINGDTVVVGASYTDGVPSNSGSVYILERNLGGSDNWGERIEITASDAAASEFFSFEAVSVDGDTVVVGSAYNDGSKGAAYVFERNLGGANNWGEAKKLVALDAFAGDHFGASVSVDGDTAVVGARYEDTDAGAAYVFGRNTGGAGNWGEVKKLIALDAASGDNFGNAVAIAGDLLVVGARYDAPDKTGAAYVFARNQGGADNWGQVAKLTASDIAVDDEFGLAVSIDGDLVVVGAPRHDDIASLTGAAYIFSRNQGGANNWGEVLKLLAFDAVTSDQFGTSVSVDGDVVIVGAVGVDEASPNAGAAYVFNRNQGGADNWGQVAKITASDADSGDRFGEAVSVAGGFAIVGAFRNADAGSSSGSVYIFEF